MMRGLKKNYTSKLLLWTFFMVLFYFLPLLYAQPLEGRRIGLDPGHGDGVNQGVYISEGTWVRLNANRTKELMEDAGAWAPRTRTDGTDHSIAHRRNLLNSWDLDLAISIHSNAGPAAAEGFEVYYCSQNPYPTTSRNWGIAIMDRAQSDVHDNIRWPGIKECLDAGRGFHFGIIREWTHMPIALPEWYFHSNDYENYNFHYLESGRELIAQAHFHAACDWYGTTPDPPKSTEFDTGDWVQTTADPNLNLREGPGTDYDVITGASLHTIAQVQSHDDNGIYRTNNNWWYVELYECGTTGWFAEYYLEETSAPVCVVSTPQALSGTLTGQTHQAHTYSTGGAECSCGADVEYFYDWDDGTTEGWTASTSASRTWTEGGVYEIQALARCADTQTESAPSSTTTVTMHHLNRIEISGPVALPFNTTYQYEANAIYNDGSTAIVTPDWSLTMEPYLHETFDSYTSQQMFEAVWTPLEGDGLTLTDDESHSSGEGHSVKQDHTAHASVKNLEEGYHGTDSEPLVLEFWMYDSEPSLTNARHFISLAAWEGNEWGSGELENLVAMGIYNTPHESADYYKIRTVEGGSDWAGTTIPRSAGWRNMKVRILSEEVEYYVDEELAYTDDYEPPANGWNSIRLGSGLTSTDEFEVYYDDIKVYTEAAPDSSIAQISENGALTTYDTAANIRLSATYNEEPTTRSTSQTVILGESYEIMIEDFESYTDTNDLKTRWQSGGEDYGYNDISLITSGGAEETDQYLEMTASAWGSITEAEFENVTPKDGSYFISFHYMNGHKDNPIDNSLDFEVYRDEDLLDQTPLQTSTVDSWQYEETGVIDLSSGDSIRIRIDGMTSGETANAFAIDQIRLTEIESVAAPVFDPSPGMYSTPQDVLISCPTSEAVIHYTTDGSDPADSETALSGEPGESILVTVPMYTTKEIRAYATHEDWDDSPETSGTYTVEPELTALQIEGPSDLSLNGSYQYTARAFYSDGTDEEVSVDWDLDLDVPDTIDIFSEDFTAYADQSAFESAWEPHSDGSLHLSTEEVRSTQSAMQDDDLRANYYALEDSYQGSDDMPLVIEFWMYDSEPDLTNARHFISLASWSGGAWGEGDLENMLALGIHNDPSGPEYKARTLCREDDWVATSIDRSTGWRKMTIRILSSDVEFYVDDTLAYDGPYDVPDTGWNTIRLGSELSSTHEFNVYYDDLVIYKETDTSQPPAQISSDGELTTEDIPLEGILSASFTDNGVTETASRNITILDLEVMLTHLTIEGETELERGAQYEYTCIAHYSDDTSEAVNPDRWIVHGKDDFHDDFSAYDTQQEFTQSWPLISEEMDPLILNASFQPPLGRGKSVMQDQEQRAQIYNLPQPLVVNEDQPVVFTFWMHDAHPTATNIRNFISFAAFSEGSWGAGELENLLAFGVHRTPDSDTYNIRILEGGSSEHEQGWDETTMVRQRGWHFVEIHLEYPNFVQFYVNGTQVHEDNHTVPESGWNSIRLGSGLESSSEHEFHYSAITAGRKPHIEITPEGTLLVHDNNNNAPSSFSSGPYQIFTGSGNSQDEEYEVGAVYTEEGVTVGGELGVTVPPSSIEDWHLY